MHQNNACVHVWAYTEVYALANLKEGQAFIMTHAPFPKTDVCYHRFVFTSKTVWQVGMKNVILCPRIDNVGATSEAYVYTALSVCFHVVRHGKGVDTITILFGGQTQFTS